MPDATPTPSGPAIPASRAAGLYVHIPFCRRKCPYCDFYSLERLDSMSGFGDLLSTEIALRGDPRLAADTIYLGGGTPSLMPPDGVAGILEALGDHFLLEADVECTMEINPGTVSRASLSAYRQAGINRLTIGIQSFSDDSLAFLGRIHSARDGIRAVQEARDAGVENLGIDLIYGLPGQEASDWLRDLETAVALSPEHLSCYLLTVEAGTPLGRDCREGRTTPLPDDDQAHLFTLTREVLTKAGYRHYEISSFARSPGTVSRHNMKYWTFAPYLGFGPSAHSYRDPIRSWNARDLDRYRQCLEKGQSPEDGRETLSREQRMIEAVFLGLRMIDGIDTDGFARRFGGRLELLLGPVLAGLEGEGMVVRSGNRIALTPAGLLVADGVARRLVDAL
jgi:oxygen-independent coproporphyrinogen-3 oxidase